jgi:hypothetical protein
MLHKIGKPVQQSLEKGIGLFVSLDILAFTWYIQTFNLPLHEFFPVTANDLGQ